jgi:hypothetical protein
MSRSSGVQFRIALFCLTLLIFFQNCSSGFQVGSTENSLSSLSPSATPAQIVGPKAEVYARDPLSDSLKTTTIGLSFLDTSGSLKNRYFGMTTDTLFPSDLAHSASDFEFAPSKPQFDEANSYYHATRVIKLYQGLGVDLSSLSGIVIDAHCDQQDNAFYNHLLKSVCLGYSVVAGEKIFAAKDSDVSLHEFNHSLNRVLNSDDVFISSPEITALDEATSDFWANVITQDPRLAIYFGTAINGSGGSGVGINALPITALRTANLTNIKYPEYFINEPHADGNLVSTILWRSYQSFPLDVQKTLFLKSVLGALQSLQVNDGIKQFMYKLLLQLQAKGLNQSQVSVILNEYNILRTDDLAGLSISTLKPYVIVDDLFDQVTSSINCNSKLEVGETALVLLNLQNSGNTTISDLYIEGSSKTAGLEVLAGGDYGFVMRLLPSKDFIGSLPNVDYGDNVHYRRGATFFGSFLVTANSTGTFNIDVTVKSFSSITGQTQSKIFSVPIQVTAKNATDTCPSSVNIWP